MKMKKTKMKNTLIANIYNKIIRETGLYNLDYFIEEHEGGYEEMPILDYFPQAKFLKRVIKKEEISALLLDIALFFVNIILLYAYNKLTEKQFANFFIAIFVVDFDHLEEDYGDYGHFNPGYWSVVRRINILSYRRKCCLITNDAKNFIST